MALTANPLVNPRAFDTLTVAGVVSPGLVRVTGGERVYDLDIKKSPGSQGTTITYRGWQVSDSISLYFFFWEREQIDAFFASFLPLFQIDANKTAAKAVDVFHPALNANNINSILTKKIGQLTPEDKSAWSLTIEVVEYKPAPKKNATSTPTSSSGTDPANAAAKPTALDEQDKQIAALFEQAKRPVP
jgi:hypothetical protein